MPQHVFIQADIPAAPSLAKKSAVTADNSSSQAFAAELNKYSQSNNASQSAANDRRASSSQQETEVAAKQSEKNTVDDGNKLPPDDALASNEPTDKSENDANPATDSDEQAADTSEASTDKEAISAEAELVGEGSDKQQTGPVIATNSQGLTSDKPIRAQVEVSQKALDNAKAAPVEMSVRAKPFDKMADTQTATDKPAAKVAEAVLASDKKVSSDQKQAGSALSQEKSTPIVPAKLDTGLNDEITTKKGQPNLAAVLEAKEKADAKPISIRADILDALQRKNGDKDIAMNLRNVIAAQMQEQSDKPDMTKALLAAERAGQEAKAASPGTAFSTLNAASASTSGTIQTAISAQGVSLPVQPTLQNPAWSQVMSSRVVWMAKEGVHQAELRMTPANLGPVEVRLQVQNDQASVTFLAQHSATRDALEQALPRLRESFAEAGIELGHTEVGEQQHQDSETEHADDAHIFTQASGAGDDIENEQEEQQPLGETSAGLSLYA